MDFNVWQKPLQYCKVISLQLIKKKKKRTQPHNHNPNQDINIDTLKSSNPQIPFRHNELFQ